MNPIKLSHTLQDTLVRYLSTTFNVNRDGHEAELAYALRSSFETPGALFNGPYLELTPPYRTSSTLADLCAEGVLSPRLRELDCFQHDEPLPLDAPLFTHQEAAIRKLCVEGRNVVVSSGTGSGKTECFLIPILNDLLTDPTPGVRALLIYPMNALVNDQLERLRVLLKGTPITFGRYTSELPNALREVPGEDRLPNEVVCRDQIRSRQMLPQILITNYAMLEYLLLRPEDSPLFEQGSWRFIVLDEAHTYIGAQGIEVAMLLRRLKHRLGHVAGETCCVATSATLANDETDKAAEFATDLFGEPFGEEDIIFGEVNTDYWEPDTELREIEPTAYTADDFEALLADIRNEAAPDVASIAIRMCSLGLIQEDQLVYAEIYPDNVSRFLWEALRNNYDLVRLRMWMLEQPGSPVTVVSAAHYLFGMLPVEARTQALYHLVELGALARPAEDKPPLLPARYHLFARAPQGIWVCLNPGCPGRISPPDAGWSRISAIRRDICDSCGCAMYPLTVCRTCGQSYIRTEFQERRFLSEANPLLDFSPRYFTWSPIVENRALADVEDDEEELVAQQEAAMLEQAKQVICLRCRRLANECECGADTVRVAMYLVQRLEVNKKRRDFTRSVAVDLLEECCRCHDRSIRGTEIATPISMTGHTPLAIITGELYRQLPPSTREEARHKPGEGRKLLSFFDSRQGAARFAAFLQDSVNSQTYRHIIPKAAYSVWKQKGFWPDLHVLSEQIIDIAWQARVFHNDLNLEDIGFQRHMSRAQRYRLAEVANRQVIAEFTTGRRSRASLESLGLLAVEYFEDGSEPDFAMLAAELDMSPEATRMLIECLLDDLRSAKIVTLPDGVLRDDEIFGRNKFSPRLVRATANAARQEIPWIGATPRQRRRQYLKSVLAYEGLPAGDDDVEKALRTIFTWLVHSTELLTGAPAEGYQIDHTRLLFNPIAQWYRCNRCLRLSPRGDYLPCPYPHCGGTLEPVDIEIVQRDDFFFQLFHQDVIPMRAEEHTAQIDSVKGRDYQNGFKNGSINVLSCSTTFEMGVDLGDLQAILMCNVPPTVANYRQRAGRAGRRASGTAFILTWASDRPHDQTYFNMPPEIIRGRVRVPYLMLDNPFIRQRHVNAILLSAFLRYLHSRRETENLSQVGAFFDPQAPGKPHYDVLDDWLSKWRDEIITLLDGFASAVAADPSTVNKWIEAFQADMREKACGHYRAIAGFYREEIHRIAQETIIAGGNITEEMSREQNRYRQLLDRINREYLIDYLSDKGVLPSYAFPLYTVELSLPPERGEHLRLQRDLRLAIREYAPGSEIVADKRLWRSAGLSFFRGTPKVWYYRLCEQCNHLQIGRDAGIRLENDEEGCPICGKMPSGNRRSVYQFMIPDGFQADPRSGNPAGQYVHREPNLMRSGVLPRPPEDEQQFGSIVNYAYERNGELLYVNEGVFGGGFRICFACGKSLGHRDRKCSAKYRGKPCLGTPIETVTLGHRLQTDILHLSFVSTPDFIIPDPRNMSFWFSLMYALLQGASRVLQIERRDIDGVLYPRAIGHGVWQQTIALYDNVPGGAGHVKRIQEEFPDVIEEAARVANCVDCAPETSCYNCLRDFSNQTYHYMLRRGPVAQFLEQLRASLAEVDSTISGAGQVIATNLPRWLIQQIERSQHRLVMAVDGITRAAPLGERRAWLEVIQELLLRGVSVHLILSESPGVDVHDPENLSINRHLQLLLERGDNPLQLWCTDSLPEWRIFIDPDGASSVQRAVRLTDNRELILGESTGQGGMWTTIHPEGVRAAYTELMSLPLQPITSDALALPPGVTVLNLPRRSHPSDTEETLFGDVFAIPVREMVVNDRYLYDHERIVNRLGAYIEMAQRSGALQKVTVHTLRAGKNGVPGNSGEQDAAIRKLTKRYGQVVEFRWQAEHDRYILLRRTDGTQARILIGRGLDFISSDGRVLPTYVVIEDMSSQ